MVNGERLRLPCNMRLHVPHSLLLFLWGEFCRRGIWRRDQMVLPLQQFRALYAPRLAFSPESQSLVPHNRPRQTDLTDLGSQGGEGIFLLSKTLLPYQLADQQFPAAVDFSWWPHMAFQLHVNQYHTAAFIIGKRFFDTLPYQSL